MGTGFRLSASTQGSIASAIPTCACVLGAHSSKDFVEGESPKSARSTEASGVYPSERWHRGNTGGTQIPAIPTVRMDGTCGEINVGIEQMLLAWVARRVQVSLTGMGTADEGAGLGGTEDLKKLFLDGLVSDSPGTSRHWHLKALGYRGLENTGDPG